MDFNLLALECAPWVAPQTMAAIVKTESQFNPLAININAGAKLERQPKTKQEAVVTAKWLLANNYNIDMGLGQVNSANLTKTKMSVEDAFDECKNLRAAASILKWNFQSASKKIPGEQAALHAAISAYNTGSFTRGFSNGYVQKVVNSANNTNLKTHLVSKDSDIKPIKLINSTKAETLKKTIKALPELPQLKVNNFKKTDSTEPDSEMAVYRGNETAQNIMVYR